MDTYQYNCMTDRCQLQAVNIDYMMRINNWKKAGKEKKPVMWFYILAYAAIVD